MSELYDGTILERLQQATEAAVLASDTPSLPVAYLGRTFVVPNDQKYLEEVFIPNNREDTWGDQRHYQGMYRLILHWPKDDKGVHVPIGVLGSITAYFSKTKLLQDVQISGNPTFGGMLAEKAENLYPASMRYTCFH